MDVQKSADRFNEAVSPLPSPIRQALCGIPRAVRAVASEVRLRVGSPISITSAERCWFVDKDSQLHNLPKHCSRLSPDDIAACIAGLCSFSVHSHEQEFISGYVSLRGGHRAGICGSAVQRDGKISAVRDITSINIRVAREVHGTATPLIQRIFDESVQGVLIAGIPSSGKTTVLRDLARQLAGGELGRYIKVAVVDERGELGAVYDGVPQNDLGATCDILTGYPKGYGILLAVRTLSPEVIICDEIGSMQESESMLDGIGSGVKMIASVHASTLGEVLRKAPIRKLLEAGAFQRIVLLEGAQTPGQIREIIEVGEQHSEAGGPAAAYTMLYDDRDVHGIRLVQASHDH